MSTVVTCTICVHTEHPPTLTPVAYISSLFSSFFFYCLEHVKQILSWVVGAFGFIPLFVNHGRFCLGDGLAQLVLCENGKTCVDVLSLGRDRVPKELTPFSAIITGADIACLMASCVGEEYQHDGLTCSSFFFSGFADPFQQDVWLEYEQYFCFADAAIYLLEKSLRGRCQLGVDGNADGLSLILSSTVGSYDSAYGALILWCVENCSTSATTVTFVTCWWRISWLRV